MGTLTRLTLQCEYKKRHVGGRLPRAFRCDLCARRFSEFDVLMMRRDVLAPWRVVCPDCARKVRAG